MRACIHTYLRTYEDTYIHLNFMYMFFVWHRCSVIRRYIHTSNFHVHVLRLAQMFRNTPAQVKNHAFLCFRGGTTMLGLQWCLYQGLRCFSTIVLHGLFWPLSQESGKPTPTLLYNCYGGGCREALRFFKGNHRSSF